MCWKLIIIVINTCCNICYNYTCYNICNIITFYLPVYVAIRYSFARMMLTTVTVALLANARPAIWRFVELFISYTYEQFQVTFQVQHPLDNFGYVAALW